MFASSWLRQLQRRWFTGPVSIRPARQRPCVRPRLEALEDRLAPAAFHVANTNSDGPGSLSEAITLSNNTPGPNTIDFYYPNPDGSILIVEGTINLNGTELPTITNDVTITGDSNVTISGANQSRVLEVASGFTAGLSDLTITDGNAGADIGGAIVNNGTLTLDDCTISNSQAGYGGAICNFGTLSLDQSTLTNNQANTLGGAICNLGTLSILNSTLSGNQNLNGSGGAILSDSNTSVSIANSTLSNNSAPNATGGAISNLAGQCAITGSDINNNEAAYGGGIFNGGSLSASNATISGNQALCSANPAQGGGIYAYGGSVTLDHVKLQGNLAQGGNGAPSGNGQVAQGGGLYAGGGTVQILSSTINGNTAQGGNGGAGAPGSTGAAGGQGYATFLGKCFSGGGGGNGGAGGPGGSGGTASGGGLFVGGATVDIQASTLSANVARGGIGGTGGTGGTGGAGGVGYDIPYSPFYVAPPYASNGGPGGEGGSPGSGGNGGDGNGGGLEIISGSVVLSNSTVAGNETFAGAGGSGGIGGSGGNGGRGGINYNRIDDATDGGWGGIGRVSGNGGNGGSASGGGLADLGGSLTASNTTVAYNQVTAGAAGVAGARNGVGGLGGAGEEGGSNGLDPGSFPFLGLDGTAGVGSGGGIDDTNPTSGGLNVSNSIVALNVSGANTPSDITNGSGTTPIASFDLIGTGGSGGIANAGANGNNILGVANPELGPLANNGGPTQTIALLPGSPALDAGGNSLVPAGVTTDQRGFARISGAAVDIGAFEMQPPSFSTTTLPNGTYGAAYTPQTIAATATGGASGPLTFALTAGTLPNGLNLASNGTLSGTPSAAGTFTFTVTATDSDADFGSQNYTVTVAPAPPTLTISDAGGTYNGNPFPATATAVGLDGQTPVSGSFSYTYYQGADTSGTNLGSTAPTNAGTYTVVANFTSSNPDYTNGSAQITFTINPLAVTLSGSRTYDGTTTAASAILAITNFIGSDNVTLSGSATLASANTGTEAITDFTGLTLGGTASGNYTLTGASGLVTISPAVTTTSTVSLSTATAVYGQPVTLTATVSNTQTAVAPSGSVTFYSAGTELAAIPVAAGGIATLTDYTLPVGNNTITASFSDPAGNFLNSSSAALASLTISEASSTTTLTATTNSPVFGQAVTFTATVAAVSPSVATPTGNVTFKDGSTTLATIALSGGSASFTTTHLALGNHSITASYSGTSNFSGSSATAYPLTVSKDGTTAMVASSVSSPVYGQSVTLHATVTASAPGSGTPTGNVTFYDGSTLLGTAKLSNGVATLKTKALSVGSNSLTVVYGGDSHFVGTTSPALVLTVSQDGTTTKLTSSSPTAPHGSPVTFTATVLPVAPGSGTPTGTVWFYDGSTLLGTATLSNGVAKFNFTFTLPGAYKIKAVYNGDSDFLSSTSSVLTQTIT